MRVSSQRPRRSPRDCWQTYKITGGTGAYQGAKGTFAVTQIPNTNNADVVVTWSN